MTTEEITLPYFWQSTPFQFKHPFGARIVGPTQAGKSHFVIKLLRNVTAYISPPPTKIYWAYGERNEKQMQKIQENSELPVHFIEGLPNIEEFTSDENNLLILDDLMSAASNSVAISDLFTRASHHRNMSVILILQNLFHQGKSMRDISLNAKYTVLFKNPRDKGQIQHLGRQIFPQFPHFLINAYDQATERPHGYLILDFDQLTPEEQRVITGIFPPEIPITFVPKKLTSR
jgi:hypothetical protein